MKICIKLFFVLTLTISFFLTTIPINNADAKPNKLKKAKAAKVMKGQYIIKYKDGSSSTYSATDNMMFSKQGIRFKKRFKHNNNMAVAELSQKDLQVILNDNEVEYVEEDQLYHALAQQNVGSSGLWGLDRIDSSGSTRLDQLYRYTQTGKGVRVYVLDTGINSHSDFTGRVSCGFNAIRSENCQDIWDHGTHVAGIIGSETYGVAKDVTLINVKVLDRTGSGSNSGIIEGIDWVISQKKANPNTPMVMNMSLGGGVSSAMNSAVAKAKNAGIFVAVAAGNENANACNVSPASSSAVFTVASSDRSDRRSGFSNYGNCVNIFAPGSSVASTDADGSGGGSGNGTSYASPFVAGVAALYLQTNPNMSPDAIMNKMRQEAQTNRISDAKSGTPNLLLNMNALNNNQPQPPSNNSPSLPIDITLDNNTGNLGVVVNASNIGGGSTDVKLQIKKDNGSFSDVRTEGAAPYEWGTKNSNMWSKDQVKLGNLSSGTYTLKAIVMSGTQKGASSTKTVTVSRAGSSNPSLSIQISRNNSTGNLGVVVNASNIGDKTIDVKLQIRKNSGSYSDVRTEGEAPYEWGTNNSNMWSRDQVKLGNLSSGTYTLKAIVMNGARKGLSTTRSITVSR